MSLVPPRPLRLRRILFLLSAVGLAGLFTQTSGLFGFMQPTAQAATTFTVDSLGDAPDSNVFDNVCSVVGGGCTLRAAIQQANSTSGTDTINFSVTGTINLTGALPIIGSDINIKGPGSGLLTVRRDTGGDYRVLTIFSPTVVNISGLTLANGKTALGTTPRAAASSTPARRPSRT